MLYYFILYLFDKVYSLKLVAIIDFMCVHLVINKHC